jgi:hypothetical protein
MVIGVLFLAAPIFSQENTKPQALSEHPDISALLQKIQELENRIITMEGQIGQPKDQHDAAPDAEAEAPQPAAEAPVSSQPSAPPSTPNQQPVGGQGGAGKALNPDISALGDFISTVGHNPVQPSPSLQMHESEIGVQAILDPYARADFFLSFGEDGVNLEEGYITFTSLPAGFIVKAGKMRSAFGKVNTLHNHVLSWIDRPLATYNLVGGEDGIDDAGVSIQRIIPAPMGFFLEATGQVFRGDSADVFMASNKNDLSEVAHLRTYKDITESTNFDLGVSYARGHNDQGSDFLTQLYGIDATIHWKPLRRSIYHSILVRSELIWSHREQSSAEQKAFGFYASADYQFGQRWFLGGRYDQSDRSRNASVTDEGGSLVLTYKPSEFSLVRGQYRLTRYADATNTHEFLMQVQFALGAHGAHPF